MIILDNFDKKDKLPNEANLNINNQLSESKIELKIFPNPNNTKTLNINIKNVKNDDFLHVRLLDSYGRLFENYTKKINSTNQLLKWELNKSILPGIYYVEIKTTKNVSIAKVIFL